MKHNRNHTISDAKKATIKKNGCEPVYRPKWFMEKIENKYPSQRSKKKKQEGQHFCQKVFQPK
jgi:hypothetical protein